MADKTMTELETLQLEEARTQARERQERRIALQKRKEAIEETIRRDNANRDRIQASCSHRKGGRGTAGLYSGNDQNYAVITHRLSVGGAIVICQRCGKLWKEPRPPGAKATQQQKDQYRADLNEFRRARNLPTDNEPSGSVLFTFTSAEEEGYA